MRTTRPTRAAALWLALGSAVAWSPAHRAACAHAARSAPARRHVGMRQMECTEANVQSVLEAFAGEASSMFGRHAQAAQVGITGDVRLVEIDGPVVLIGLSGRFWHRRETVLRNAAAYLRRAIPEIASVEAADPDDLLDCIVDDETGAVVEDRRSPDFSGDRATLEYQGIDPDTRGPFAGGAGGFRAGGSMYS